MNEIIAILGNAIQDSRHLVRVEPFPRADPRAVILHFETGDPETHELSVQNLQEFMKLWKQASAWWNIRWDSN